MSRTEPIGESNAGATASLDRPHPCGAAELLRAGGPVRVPLRECCVAALIGVDTATSGCVALTADALTADALPKEPAVQAALPASAGGPQ